MKLPNKKIFDLHADFCKNMANPWRLMIIHILSHDEASVGFLAEQLGIPLANVSQHLAILRSKQIVTFRKDGQTVYYRLVDPRMNEACNLIRQILLDSLKKRGEMAEEFSEEERKAG